MKTFTLLFTAYLATASYATPVKRNASLVFGDCPTALVPPGSPLQCGSIQVPMDWSNSSSSQITVGVVKLPARDPANRIGPLFFNPGGPGIIVSGEVAGFLDGTFLVKDEILDRFDIIGVDIRGTGLSSPITCDRDLENAHPALFASTPDIFNASVEHNRAVRQSCIDKTGSNLVDFMDTNSQARDHEAVRQALGEKITWLGQSAGTVLATQYAELFAESIRGMVLDGVVSNSQAPTSMFIVDAASAEATMNNFFDWCAQSNSTDCTSLVQNTTKTLPQLWDDLMAEGAQSPIPAPQCNSSTCAPGLMATADILRQAAVQMLYQGDGKETLASALRPAVIENDATNFLQYATGIFSVPQGADTYTASYYYGLNAIVCQDFAHEEASPAQIAWWQQIGKNDMPHTQGNTATLWFLYVCIGWPRTGLNGPHRISIPDTLSSKVLLVSNLYDPSTPTGWDLQVAEEIGLDRATIIGRNQTGHTAWLEAPAYDGPTVAAINNYLLTLEVPEQGTIYES